jgi:hypothetical protein
VNAVVTPQVMDELVRRAQAVGATKSEYAAMIIRQWHSKGCPPVSDLERRLLEAASPAAGERR